MFEPVPAVPPVVAPPPLSFSVSVGFFSGVPFLAYVTFSRVVLSTLRSAVTWTWALPGPSVRTSSELRSAPAGARVAGLERLLAGGPPPPPEPSPDGHSSEPDGVGDRDVVGLEALHGRGDELGDAAHGAGLERVGRVAEHDRGGGRRRLVGEQVVLGQHELDLRVLTPSTRERPGDLTLQRALVGDLLLEVGRAELLLVEELEARLEPPPVADTLAGERDARRRHGGFCDRERGAVVAQLVGDALLVQRGGDLAGLGGVEAAGHDRVRRRRGDPQHDERDRQDGHGGDAEDRLRLAGSARKFSRKDGIESAQTWVWKMSWAASTAFVRIWLASCMASWARSTAMTTAVGSVA